MAISYLLQCKLTLTLQKTEAYNLNVEGVYYPEKHKKEAHNLLPFFTGGDYPESLRDDLPAILRDALAYIGCMANIVLIQH